MRISDWSSDVCSSDLERCGVHYSKVVHNVRCSPPAEKLLPARTKLLCLRHSPARCRRWSRSSIIAAAAAVAAANEGADVGMDAWMGSPTTRRYRDIFQPHRVDAVDGIVSDMGFSVHAPCKHRQG